MSLKMIDLGRHLIEKPLEGEPAYLSAASGVAWNGSMLYSVGDDQAALIQYPLSTTDVSGALRWSMDCDLLQPGVARRIIPGVLPQDVGLRAEAKPDFEAMTIITQNHLLMLPDGPVKDEVLLYYPYGMLFIAGSGGMSRKGVRRSIGVVYALDNHGRPIGGPTKIDLNGLHEHLEQCLMSEYVLGELNIEGVCVYGTYETGMRLVLAQRGNCTDKNTGRPGENMLIQLSLQEVVWSIIHDLQINAVELLSVTPCNDILGHVTVFHDNMPHQVKLDFTDLDSVANDEYGRMVFTAAAEGVDGPFKGRIAGSVIGVINTSGAIHTMYPLTDTSIKLEGITAWAGEFGSIEFLVVDDADNPGKVAMLRGGVID